MGSGAEFTLDVGVGLVKERGVQLCALMALWRIPLLFGIRQPICLNSSRDGQSS